MQQHKTMKQAIRHRGFYQENPGKGDCMYYSFALALLPFIQQELLAQNSDASKSTPLFDKLVAGLPTQSKKPSFRKTILAFNYRKINKSLLNTCNLALRNITKQVYIDELHDKAGCKIHSVKDDPPMGYDLFIRSIQTQKDAADLSVATLPKNIKNGYSPALIQYKKGNKTELYVYIRETNVEKLYSLPSTDDCEALKTLKDGKKIFLPSTHKLIKHIQLSTPPSLEDCYTNDYVFNVQTRKLMCVDDKRQKTDLELKESSDLNEFLSKKCQVPSSIYLTDTQCHKLITSQLRKKIPYKNHLDCYFHISDAFTVFEYLYNQEKKIPNTNKQKHNEVDAWRDEILRKFIHKIVKALINKETTKQYTLEKKYQFLLSRLLFNSSNSSTIDEQKQMIVDDCALMLFFDRQYSPGKWSVEQDIMQLSEHFEVDVYLYGNGSNASRYDTNSTKPHLNINQPNAFHWNTLIDPFYQYNEKHIIADSILQHKQHLSSLHLTTREIQSVFSTYVNNSLKKFSQNHLKLAKTIIAECDKNSMNVDSIMKYITDNLPDQRSSNSSFVDRVNYLLLRYKGETLSNYSTVKNHQAKKKLRALYTQIKKMPWKSHIPNFFPCISKIPTHAKQMLDLIDTAIKQEMRGSHNCYQWALGDIISLAAKALETNSYFRDPEQTQTFYEELFKTLEVDVDATLVAINEKLRATTTDKKWGTQWHHYPTTVNNIWNYVRSSSTSTLTPSQQLIKALSLAFTAKQSNGSFWNMRSQTTENFYAELPQLIQFKDTRQQMPVVQQ